MNHLPLLSHLSSPLAGPANPYLTDPPRIFTVRPRKVSLRENSAPYAVARHPHFMVDGSGRLPMSRRDERDLVVAAQRGDRRAREELARTYLPLVYNVVGRAL